MREYLRYHGASYLTWFRDSGRKPSKRSLRRARQRSWQYRHVPPEARLLAAIFGERVRPDDTNQTVRARLLGQHIEWNDPDVYV